MSSSVLSDYFISLIPQARKEFQRILEDGTNLEKIKVVNSLLDRLGLPKGQIIEKVKSYEQFDIYELKAEKKKLLNEARELKPERIDSI